MDFRGFSKAVFTPSPEGTTVITGPNGAGKTTVLEAIAYLGTQRSFRGAPREMMIRTGCARAVLRAELARANLPVLVEAEIVASGRSRAQVNRQAVRSRRDMAEAVPVTIFCPDDLGIVQGGPGRRRDLLDDALRLIDGRAAALLDDVERIIRQRGALLRQAGGRITPEVMATLQVWDDRLATAGDTLAESRESLVASLRPYVMTSYAALAGIGEDEPELGRSGGMGSTTHLVGIAYHRTWEGNLSDALAETRAEDLRRATTTVGPHRDDLVLRIAGRDARLQASQGEQRCLALALRLGVHRLVTERSGTAPILLLDDVFSELDPSRSRALVNELPAGQTLLTTSCGLAEGVSVASSVEVGELTTREKASGGEGFVNAGGAGPAGGET